MKKNIENYAKTIDIGVYKVCFHAYNESTKF